MTVITALYDPDEKVTWLGSNGRVTIGNFIGPSLDRKWIAFDEWVIGMTGTGPKEEVLRAEVDKFPKEEKHPFEILKFMRTAYLEYDIGEMDEGLKRFCGSGMLVHKSGAIWDFDNSFCLTKVDRNVFWARGSGMDIAIGAGRALTSFVSSPKEITKRVVEIVVSTDIDCPGEVVLQSFDENGVLSEPLKMDQ